LNTSKHEETGDFTIFHHISPYFTQKMIDFWWQMRISLHNEENIRYGSIAGFQRRSFGLV
jgi:hypothetical protein